MTANACRGAEPPAPLTEQRDECSVALSNVRLMRGPSGGAVGTGEWSFDRTKEWINKKDDQGEQLHLFRAVVTPAVRSGVPSPGRWKGQIGKFPASLTKRASEIDRPLLSNSIMSAVQKTDHEQKHEPGERNRKKGIDCTEPVTEGKF